MAEKYAFLLMTDEKKWNSLCDRTKDGGAVHAFVRRSLVGPKTATLLLFYVKHPARQVKGVGEFIERVTGDAEKLWQRHGAETCFQSHSEYAEFMQDREKATFIRFKNLKQLQTPVAFGELAKKASIVRVPRSGKYLSQETVNQIL